MKKEAAVLRGPHFICPGLQKAATGWLFDQLAAHPDVWMPPVKELHYFDEPAPRPGLLRRLDQYRHDRDRADRKRAAAGRAPFDQRDDLYFQAVEAAAPAWGGLNRYAAFFEPAGGCLTGDITPGYSTLSAERVGEIGQSFPTTRIVILVRDPAERAASQMRMMVRKGLLEPEPLRSAEGLKAWLASPEVAARSFPSIIVSRWRNAFSHCEVFFMDDLAAAPDVFRARLFDFLGVDASLARPPADLDRKRDDDRLALAPEQISIFETWFTEERRRCAETLGGPALTWPGRRLTAGSAK